MFKRMKMPSCIQLELTNLCNQKCRHCYNYWREGDFSPIMLSREKLDFMLDEFIKCRVFNVVFSGGEPFINFDQLLYGVKKLTGAGISTTSDTNLMLATEDRLKMLYDAGLGHVLTSFNSYDEATNDFIVSCPGAQKKIIKGIEAARKVGMRVSVNIIISNLNKGHVYGTGKFLSQFGINKFFSTRTVPSIASGAELSRELTIDPKEELRVLDEMIRVRDDFGIPIGSLIQFPVCFLGDVEKYKDYVGRGCTAGKKMVCLDVHGNGHACVHEAKSYGNIFEIGLGGIWNNLEEWKDSGILPEDCRGCSWEDKCEGGCRFSAFTEHGDIRGRDRLMLGSEIMRNIPRKGIPKEIYDSVDNDTFYTLGTLRFRDEGDFYTISRLGADVVQAGPEIARFLEGLHKKRAEFTLKDLGLRWRDDLARAVFEGLVLPAKGNAGSRQTV
ncbi:MAG: radical SAM protein [Candidatus Omnitrophota bacterium]